MALGLGVLLAEGHRAILALASSTGADIPSDGERLALGVTGADGRLAGLPLADRVWRALWYFVVSPAAAIIATARYFDLVPDEKVSWKLPERMRHLLFEGGGASVRPILHDHALEGEIGSMAHLPYVNPPVTSWAEIALVVAAVLMTWRCIGVGHVAG